MVTNVDSAQGGGKIEVSRDESGTVLVSFLSNDGESFHWWKLPVASAEQLGQNLKDAATDAWRSAIDLDAK